MGRDKKNPTPLDVSAFNTLVKTASEVLRRAEQYRHAMLHKSVTVTVEGEAITVELDIVPDAVLLAKDVFREQLASVKVRPDFKLNAASALAWIESGYRSPR